MTRKRRKFPYWLTIIVLLLVGVASWAVYSILNKGAGDLLALMGITNFYVKGLIIVAVIFIVLLIIGFGGKKSFESIIGKR